MGHPRFGIENRATRQREFTVTLPTCCFNAYNCTDVVYDVHGKTEIILTEPLLYLFQIILETW